MALGVAGPALAADMATFAGTVFSPDNSFAQGFTVVFKDTATGQEFRSGPTTGAGEYQVSVPTGARYKLDHVLAPDGTKLPVQDVPPIPVRVPGSNRLDVKFTNVVPPPSPAPAAAAAGTAAAAAKAPTPGPAPQPTTASAATPPPEKKKKDKSGTPWWKRPGPIVGIVLGAAAVAALALSGGGDGGKDTASASTPNN